MKGRCERQDGDITGSFDSNRHLPLVLCTVSRDPPRNDFPSFRNEESKDPGVLIVDVHFLIGTESTDLPSQKRSFLPVGSWPFRRSLHDLLLSQLD